MQGKTTKPMVAKTLFLLNLLLLLSLSVDLAFGIPWGNLLDGWPPIRNVNDDSIQSMAKFAIREYNNRFGDNLKYVQVLSGGSRPRRYDPGRDYRLVILAYDGDSNERSCIAVVYKNPEENSLELVSFNFKN